MRGLTLEAVVRTHPDVVLKKVRGSLMLLHIGTSDYFSMNATGEELWALADGRRTVRGIAAEFARSHGAALEEAEKDVLGFFRELARHRLVEASS